MAEVIWAEPALNDLEAIAYYIALDNPQAGRGLVQKIFEMLIILKLSDERENLCAHICQLVCGCGPFTRSLSNTPIKTLYLISKHDT